LKTRFILNPRSGRAARALPALRTFAAQNRAELVLTERPRHATDLAARALDDRCDLIVAVGGDGTMNEVATALIDTPATLGLVPCGSGDGLGRHLGIHGPVAHALRILKMGTPRLIDTGLADGHPFFTAAGLGFEAHIAEKFNTLTSRGFLRYLTTSATAFARWQPERFTITTADARHEITAFTLAVANSDQYGNNALIAPGARADDALLDLTAIPRPTFTNSASLLARLFHGSIDRHRGVLHLRAPRFTVERPAPGPLHTDGELHSAGRIVEFALRPASLRIMAPA
jgi:lipid kinase, YegS/Rv2252/BmrU family